MSLRKHQVELSKIISGIIGGSKIRTVYCHCTPGSGKSILPIIAGKLITAGLADKMIWIAPRLSLIDQAEREFVNPYFRELLNHRLLIRSSTNENNPCRGLHGFATTYNAVGMDDGALQYELQRYRYILILDEFHHVQEDSLWHKKIQPLFDMAAFRVLMTGTVERGDGTRIAFMPYRGNGSGLVPNLLDTGDTSVIFYGREDALGERAIIPLSFHLSDARAEWQERTGRRRSITSIDTMNESLASKAIYTALRTEFAEELLESGLAHWQEHRRRVPGAKCLVVTSNIEEAKRHTKAMKAMGFGARFEIATSEDSPAALKVIKKMKAGEMDVLVTVAMAYEGLNIPAVSHIICLTRIRSTPWIEQMTARANRIDPGAGPYDEQMGHIFAPADPLFKEIVSRIEAEQLPMLRDREAAEKSGRAKPGEGDGFFLQPSPGGITALSSGLTGKREVVLGNGAKNIPQNIPYENAELLLPSEIEADLLGQIESHIRIYAFKNRFNPKQINGEVYEHFYKARRDMTIEELKKCLAHVQAQYPLSRIRGTGRRVPTKAQPFPCTWRNE